MSTGDADAGSSSKARPVSTVSISSQLSISDRMTDGDEEDVSLRNLMTGTASSCSSLNISRSLPQDQSQASQSQMRLSSSPTTMPRTTTISTIAMESNTGPPGSKCSRTRLVIALLQVSALFSVINCTNGVYSKLKCDIWSVLYELMHLYLQPLVSNNYFMTCA